GFWGAIESGCGVHGAPGSLARCFAKLPIHQFLNKLDALEFHEAEIFLYVSIERHTDLPGSRKDFRVLDDCFIMKRVRAYPRVALDDMQFVAVVVASTIKPGVFVQARHVNYQRVSLPMPDGLPH